MACNSNSAVRKGKYMDYSQYKAGCLEKLKDFLTSEKKRPGASINYGQLLVEYLYQDWRYPIWPLNMILILRR